MLPGNFLLSRIFFKLIKNKYFLFKKSRQKQIVQLIFLIFLDSLEDFQTVWEIPDSLKIFGQGYRFLYSLRNVLDSQEDFQTV